MSKIKLKPGDYVVATKYPDGCPRDHFCVGFFVGMLYERYLVESEPGQLFRAGGFRRCEKISPDIGNLIVSAIPFIEQGAASVWWWRYHPTQLRHLLLDLEPPQGGG